MSNDASKIDWTYWNGVAQTLGGFATVLTLFVALGALVLAVRQISAANAISREAGARQALRDYLELCFNEPTLSSWEMYQKAYPDVLAETIEDAAIPETERYLWFLSILLSTCEEMSAFVSAKGKWRRTLVLHVRLHAGVFKELWPRWKRHYSDDVRSIVAEALEKPQG